MEQYQRIRVALESHSTDVFDLIAMQLSYLGSRAEWSIDDNLEMTEEIARLAGRVGLPDAGDQNQSALDFYRAAASHLGFDIDA